MDRVLTKVVTHLGCSSASNKGGWGSDNSAYKAHEDACAVRLEEPGQVVPEVISTVAVAVAVVGIGLGSLLISEDW